jgi:CubicO group peptidase (beta-lactamase class C family)
MHRFAWRHFVSLLVIELSGVCALSTNLSADSLETKEIIAPILTSLPDRVTTAIARDRLVSVSMAVILDTEVVFSQAFGYADIEQQRRATPGTIYPIGSITKVFTATMLAQLSERGVINLEDPVEKYLPEYQPHSRYVGMQPTTLRQLAAHTSGLPRDAPVNFWCDFAGFSWLVTGGQTPMTWYVDCETLLQSLDQIELSYSPEVYAHYSNLGMQILGMALERASGQPLVEYIEHEILDPLGMNSSGFSLDNDQRQRLARGYVCTGPEAPMLNAPTYELGCALYSGGLFSTTADLARFLSFQFHEEPKEDTDILSTGTLLRMRTPQSIHQPGVHSTYGLGWGVVRIGGHKAIEHNGALLGYHAHVSAVPELKLGIVAFSNTKNFLWKPDACKTLARSILTDLADAIYAASPDDVFNISLVNLNAYLGTYTLPGNVAHLMVSIVQDRLFVELAEVDDFAEAFEPVDRHTFCFASDPQRTPVLFFELTANGEIAGVRFLSHTFRRQDR